MKKLILILSLTFSASAFAADIVWRTTPANPIVVDSSLTFPNGTRIEGPWTRVRHTLINQGQTAVEIAKIGYTVATDVGIAQGAMGSMPPKVLQPGETFELEMYVQSLPEKDVQDYDYGILFRIDGREMLPNGTVPYKTATAVLTR